MTQSQQIQNKLSKEIIIMDGAMGTMIQKHKLEEKDFRGEIFKDHPTNLKGNNDLLSLVQPEIIYNIHKAYLKAGADIIETNTFNATSISQADYKLENKVRDINIQSAGIAKKAAKDFMEENPHRKCFVAGAIGPTNRTISIATDVENAAFRASTFNELKESYAEQIEAIVEGGVDLLLFETVFDTLNLKAALFAVEDYFDNNPRLPVMISVTITDNSGRTLSGQTPEAFWHSIKHVRPLSVGINCALGASDMRPYIERLSKISDCYISCYPNAGLPNPLSETGYDETPEYTSEQLLDFAKSGFLNMVGGCCGTTP